MYFVVADFTCDFTWVFVIFFITMFAFCYEASFFRRFRLHFAVGFSYFIDDLRNDRRILFTSFLRFTFCRRSIIVYNYGRRVRVDFLGLFRDKISGRLTVSAYCTCFEGQSTREGIKGNWYY